MPVLGLAEVRLRRVAALSCIVVGVYISIKMYHVLLLGAHAVVPLSETGHKVALSLEDFICCNLRNLSWTFDSCLLSLVTVLVDSSSGLEYLRQLGKVLPHLTSAPIVRVDRSHGYSLVVITTATPS